MRPPTPRLRINSEDFIDNDNAAGSPSDLYPSYANASSLSINNSGGGGTAATATNNNSQTYQSSVTNKPTNNTTNSYQTQSSNPFYNANVTVDDTIAMLVADSDPQDISVL